VPKLLPTLRPWRDRRRSKTQWRAARGEAFIALGLLVIYAAFRGLLFVQGG
jgi:hypothetical protein